MFRWDATPHGLPCLPVLWAIVRPSKGLPIMSGIVLWVIAAILVIVGIVQLLQGQILLGVILIVVGCLVGPGGYSVFRSRRA